MIAMAKPHAKPKHEPPGQGGPGKLAREIVVVGAGLGAPPYEIWLAGLGALALSEQKGSGLFSRLVGRGLEVEGHGGSGAPEAVSRASLGRIQQMFDLSLAELGWLFDVSRQAASSWLAEGVPSARLPKLVTILEIADLLSRQLKPGRLPGVARKPARAYGGLSLLQMIEADRHEELLELVRRSFDWAATA